MGFAIAGILLAAWGITVFAVISIAAVIVALAALATGIAAAAIRWLKFGKIDRSNTPLVIDGEYEVLDTGTGESQWRQVGCHRMNRGQE